jgi:hypothetical protein
MAHHARNQTFVVQQLPGLTYDYCIKEVESRLGKLSRTILGFTPWPRYSYKPGVQFAIVYGIARTTFCCME